LKRLLVAVLSLLLVVLGASASPAVGQVSEDSVTGSGTAGPYSFVFDAHSGPSGENPTGTATISLTSTPSVFTSGPVTCLAVEGTRAVIGIENGPGSLTAGEGTLIEVSDDPDALFFRLWFEPPSTCFTAPSGYTPTPVTSGDIRITDAQPLPTSKDQCKNGHWRDFSVFKNEGACVSFVATGDKNQPASG
jgi:hypothetical protein